MLFNSTEFVPFLLLVLLIHWVLIPARRSQARKGFLVLASYAFYMSWNPKFGLLLMFSTLVDFAVGLGLERTVSAGRRRALLIVSLATNLGLLATFKYGGFVAAEISPLLDPEIASGLREALDVALPVGISFYTFQTLSYSIDVYRRDRRATSKLLDFALYVSFFPQLVAGPIVRSSTFLPQLEAERRVTSSDFEYGLMRVLGGLAKKVLFADTLALLVDPVFANPALFGAPIRLLALYGYAYQIYFDFSGYSDIAIGLARMFGLRLPENFDRPYLAASPREFWRRWHISLSTWLRDYLYIPLGGTRTSEWRIARNLTITMVLGGLWHGAAWTFMAWGAYHAVLLVGQRAVFGTRDPGESGLPLVVRQIVTFHLVCFGWLLFRAGSLDVVLSYLGNPFEGAIVLDKSVVVAASLLLVAVGIHATPSTQRWRELLLGRAPTLQGLLYGVIALLVFLFSTHGERFIYFQF